MNKLSILLGLCISFSSFAQNDDVLMTIDDKPVYKSEFEYIFQKNNKNDKVSKEDLDEYIDLFTKFKLKVTEARELGLDTLPKLIGELKGYRTQLSRQYLVDNKLTDQLIEEAYGRMKKEVNASHILIKVPAGGDTIESYNKAMALFERAKSGENFSMLARENSEGPSGKNGGELGWFSGFRMIYRFETVAFNTEIGEVSKPVRTRYGYHIIKVNDVRNTRPDIKISHILIHVKPESTEPDKVKAEKKINEIYDLLNNGNNFKTLVENYSDDKATIKSAGSLGWISKNNFYDEIKNAAYSISENNNYSKPIKTNLGYHIIQRNELNELGSLEDNISLIKSKIQRDERGSQSKKAKVNALKKEYDFKLDVDARNKIDKIITSNDSGKKFSSETAEKYSKTLFSFENLEYTQNDFLINYYESTTTQPKQDIRSYIEIRLNNFISRKIMDFERKNLENKYPEFKSLMQEYTDGVLLFELTDQKVWSKAIKDTSGLNSFYEINKSEFMWEDRVDYDLYTSTSKKHAKKAFKMTKKGISTDSIVNVINLDSELNVNYEGGVSEIKHVELLNGKSWEQKLYKPFEKNGKYIVVNIKENLPKQSKKLDEAKGLITSKYQDYLETKWVEELKAKYKVEINKDVLYSIAK